MIKYEGIEVKDRIYFLKLSNEEGNIIEIPVEELDAKRIEMYLTKLAKPSGTAPQPSNEDL